MRTFRKKQVDEEALPARDKAAAGRPDLSLEMVYGFLRHILQSVGVESGPWRKQLAFTPRGADFDLRDANDGTTVLDKLTMTGDALAESLARGDAPGEVGQGVLPHLSLPLEALARHREASKRDPRQQALLKQHGVVLSELEDDVLSASRGMGELSRAAARGAASLDPDATRRILNRMRDLGDASLRLIEGRIVSAGTRDEGKRLRALRDDLKAWIEARNARLEQMQAAVDELNVRSSALRNECLMQAKRLLAAAALTGKTSGGAIDHTSPEAMVFSAGLRTLLLEGHTDVAAPLRE